MQKRLDLHQYVNQPRRPLAWVVAVHAWRFEMGLTFPFLQLVDRSMVVMSMHSDSCATARQFLGLKLNSRVEHCLTTSNGSVITGARAQHSTAYASIYVDRSNKQSERERHCRAAQAPPPQLAPRQRTRRSQACTLLAGTAVARWPHMLVAICMCSSPHGMHGATADHPEWKSFVISASHTARTWQHLAVTAVTAPDPCPSSLAGHMHGALGSLLAILKSHTGGSRA